MSGRRAERGGRAAGPGYAMALALLTLAVAGGCKLMPVHAPLQTVEYVDLERFMGTWYVLGAIPTFLERDAFNAVESYRLDEDGSIDTTFRFRRGGFDGEPVQYRPRGHVRDRDSNAVWGMQFLWPLQADYRIIHLAPDYSTTIVARERRDYVWIMARTPQVDEATWTRLLRRVAEAGYDLEALRRVPQRWDEALGPNRVSVLPPRGWHRSDAGVWL